MDVVSIFTPRIELLCAVREEKLHDYAICASEHLRRDRSACISSTTSVDFVVDCFDWKFTASEGVVIAWKLWTAETFLVVVNEEHSAMDYDSPYWIVIVYKLDYNYILRLVGKTV